MKSDLWRACTCAQNHRSLATEKMDLNCKAVEAFPLALGEDRGEGVSSVALTPSPQPSPKGSGSKRQRSIQYSIIAAALLIVFSTVFAQQPAADFSKLSARAARDWVRDGVIYEIY